MAKPLSKVLLHIKGTGFLNRSSLFKFNSRFRSEKSESLASNMRKFINMIPDVRSKLKIAKELNLNDIEQQLMDGAMGAYMKDHIF